MPIDQVEKLRHERELAAELSIENRVVWPYVVTLILVFNYWDVGELPVFLLVVLAVATLFIFIAVYLLVSLIKNSLAARKIMRRLE